MGARYAQHTFDHEACHAMVGIMHLHDLTWRSCITRLEMRDGFVATYASDVAAYPYKLQDTQTGQNWTWPINATVGTQ
jgi:hypothetical protein